MRQPSAVQNCTAAETALGKKKFDANDVPAARDYVAAYVSFFKARGRTMSTSMSTAKTPMRTMGQRTGTEMKRPTSPA